MPAADTARLVAELTLKDKMTPALRKADSSLKSFDRATSNTQKSLGKFGNNIGKIAKVGALAFAGSSVLVLNAARDYESAFAGVRKTVDLTDKELDELSKSIRGMAKEIPISAAELASLGETAGALGIEGKKNIEEFIRVTALLGVTTDLTAQDAANSLGVLANVLHLTGDDYDNFAASLVALGNAGASTESQIIAIAERSGAAGELIGLTTEQVLGLSSAVASLGIEEEAGGSSLQKFFIETAGFVADAGAELDTFAKISGTSAKQFKKNFEQDAGGALTRFLANLGKLTQGEQIQVLKDLGFSEIRITRTLLGLANNSKLVADQMGIANKAFKENTALTKEAEQRFKTFDSQLQITKNVLTDIGITIGTAVLPKLAPMLQRFNEFVNLNTGNIEKLAADIATGVGNIADEVARVDWTPFIDGLKFTADVGRATIDIFRGMPDWLQKLIVAGFAVNKLTGGLVTSLGKDIFGAVGSQFFARGASPANPLWVQSAGGAVGGGVAPVGAGGRLAGAANLIMKVAIVGIAADVANTLKPAVVGAGIAIHDALGLPTLTVDDLQWPFGPKNTPTILPEIFGGNGALGGTPTAPNTVRVPENPRLIEKMGEVATKQNISNERLESIRGYTSAQSQSVSNLLRSSERQEAVENAHHASGQAAAFAIRDKVGASTSILGIGLDKVRAAAAATQIAARAAGQQAAAAIKDKDLSVKVQNFNNISTHVSVRETINSQTTFKQYNRYIS